MTIRYGAVVIFNKNISEEEAVFALAKLGREGILDFSQNVDKRPVVEPFDDRYGGPVFYIP